MSAVQSATLTVMIGAARKAGRQLVRDFGEVENLQTSIKGPGDFVSAADVKSENTIREELMRARPAYGWLGEESGEKEGKDPTRRWIVDPLDGTTNFLHGLPHFSISIALEHKSEIVAGVVYDPLKNELFFAEKGGGAYLNERRIRVSARKELIESLLATGVPFAAKKTLPLMMKDLAQLMPATAGVRRLGSAALDLAYVAAGRYEAYWERELNSWDIAAGILIAREAGALVSDLEGENEIFSTGGLIATTPDLYEQIRKQLAG